MELRKAACGEKGELRGVSGVRKFEVRNDRKEARWWEDRIVKQEKVERSIV